MIRAACISDDGKYRYWLTRQWDSGCTLPFVMLNPSTADATKDDPTIRRCIGFAKREGAAAIMVVNLYAFRATSPCDLMGVVDPFGPRNDIVLRNLAIGASSTEKPIVCAWGSHADPDVAASAARTLSAHGARLVCLGKTKDGHPRHPLYVRGDQPFEAFP